MHHSCACAPCDSARLPAWEAEERGGLAVGLPGYGAGLSGNEVRRLGDDLGREGGTRGAA